MVIQPLHDKVVVQRLEEKEEVRGGIIIPDTAKEKPQRGKIVSVGQGKRLENGSRAPMTLREGNQVLFTKYGGNDVKIGDQEYLILSEDEILAIID
jgi:chaperonin GroES